jgi:hypothetical protein
MTARRPTTDSHHGSYVTTPRAAQTMRLLGAGIRHGGVTLTSDEKRAIDRLYGFVPEQPQQRPERPVEPPPDPRATYYERDAAEREHKDAVRAWGQWSDPSQLAQAGADRNALRHAEVDGLRMLAWIARHVPPGEDPVKTLVAMAICADWDVDPADVEWADGEAEEEAA